MFTLGFLAELAEQFIGHVLGLGASGILSLFEFFI